MRHVHMLTKPAKALNVDDLSKWVGLGTAVLYFVTSFANAFGVQLPQKVNNDSQQ